MRSGLLAVTGALLVAACSDGVSPAHTLAAPGTIGDAKAPAPGPARTAPLVSFEIKAFTYGPNFEVFTAAGCQHSYQNKVVRISQPSGYTVDFNSLLDWAYSCSNVLSDTTGQGGMPYDGGDITVFAQEPGGPWSVAGKITQAGLQIITTQGIPADANVMLRYELNKYQTTQSCYFMGWLKDDQAGVLPTVNDLVVSVSTVQYSQITAQMKCGGSDPNYNPPPQPQDPPPCAPDAVICEE